MTDVTAIMTFHREGVQAIPGIRSVLHCVARAKRAGLSVGLMATIDRGDATTAAILRQYERSFDRIETLDVGDLGAARNHAITLIESEHAVFFDSDDLIGEDWIALACAAQRRAPAPAVWHPEYVYILEEDDFESCGELAHPEARSHYLRLVDSASRGFDPSCLLIDNTYDSGAFAPTEVFRRFPYEKIDTKAGYGFEDWWWNLRTLAEGVRHGVVSDAVRVSRHKRNGSLGVSIGRAGFLPPVGTFADALLRGLKPMVADREGE